MLTFDYQGSSYGEKMAKNQIIYTLFDEKVILVLDMAIFCRSLSFLSSMVGRFQFVVERGEGIAVEVVEGNAYVAFYMVGIKGDFVEAGVEDAVGKHVLHVFAQLSHRGFLSGSECGESGMCGQFADVGNRLCGFNQRILVETFPNVVVVAFADKRMAVGHDFQIGQIAVGGLFLLCLFCYLC